MNNNFKEASKQKRLINFVIDTLVILIFIEITGYLENFTEYDEPLIISRVVVAFGGYRIPMELFFGRTIGKIITKTKVICIDGSKLNLRAAILRSLCRWIPFDFVSLGLGVDAKAWHDVLSKTIVIDDILILNNLHLTKSLAD